jgi:cytochrome c oxidase accessory protein FixG
MDMSGAMRDADVDVKSAPAPPAATGAARPEGAAAETATSGAAPAKPSLYASRIRVYPKKVSGRYRRLKWTALGVLLALYYVLPWIPWDRGPGAPDQAVLIDLAHERAYFFFIEIWAQEVYYLTGILILAAVGLFLVTSLAGRIWCGYACPQTVWTDLFMWVERLIEGDRNKRIMLDRGPTTAGKVARKIAKHGAWLLIAFLTGGAWIMYFIEAPTVVTQFFTGQSSGTVYFFVGLFTATTYLLAGWAREQVCTYMCPWPRFQSAMFDEDTLVVTYQKWRGEPRAPYRKGDDWDARGHCVDCKQCVNVCPTGIDIRDGVQLECIGCGLCADACDTVMDRFGLPKGLISYDTERRQEQRAAGQSLTYRLIRPRTILYAMLMVGVAGIMLFALMTRSSESLTVLHDRTLFVQLAEGGIRNGYTLRILNKQHQARRFTLTVAGLAGARLKVVGSDAKPAATVTLTGRRDGVASYKIYVTAPRRALAGAETRFHFVLVDTASGARTVRDASFKGPAR